MPLLAYVCKCGEKFDHLSGPHVAFSEPTCPSCASRNVSRAFTGVPYGSVSTTEFMEPGIEKIYRSNKAKLEADSDKILSGEIKVEERGPKEFRPKLPDSMKKYSR